MKKLTINKESSTPVYRQIIERITFMVKRGKLQAGEKLPPERELAQQLGTARGTVKKAYENLASNNIIQVLHGRGTFISSEQDVVPSSRKDQAIKQINKTLEKLEKLNFSPHEISTMFQLMLMERRRRLESFAIAALDCNPEALSIFEIQLKHITTVGIHKYLLDDLYNSAGMREKLLKYDMILTTTTHYSELLGLIPEAKDKIIKAVVSPSQQTIIDLATLPSDAKIGIICKSRNFFNIINSKLKDFQVKEKNMVCLFEDNPENLSEFVTACQVIITPPKCSLENQREYVAPFREFGKKGGRIIRFEYQLERSTLIRIEEKISELMEKKEFSFDGDPQ